jgi:elongation factor P hydroxylase
METQCYVNFVDGFEILLFLWHKKCIQTFCFQYMKQYIRTQKKSVYVEKLKLLISSPCHFVIYFTHFFLSALHRLIVHWC